MTLLDIFTNFALTCTHERYISYLTANLSFNLTKPAKINEEILMVINVKSKEQYHGLVCCEFYNSKGEFIGKGH